MRTAQKKLLFFFVLSASTLFAQESNLKEKTWVASIDMLQLVDVSSFPTLKLSVEKKITPVFSIIVGGGFRIYEPYKNYDTLYIKPSGFKMDLQVRSYILKMLNPDHFTKSGGLFVGIQGFYRQNKFTGSADYIKRNEDPNSEFTPEYTDDFGVRKKAFGVNVTSGWQKNFKSFVLEPSIGLGIMDRKITNNGLSFNVATDEFDYNHGDGIPRTENKSGTFFNFCLSFKIGYQF